MESKFDEEFYSLAEQLGLLTRFLNKSNDLIDSDCIKLEIEIKILKNKVRDFTRLICDWKIINQFCKKGVLLRTFPDSKFASKFLGISEKRIVRILELNYRDSKYMFAYENTLMSNNIKSFQKTKWVRKTKINQKTREKQY